MSEANYEYAAMSGNGGYEHALSAALVILEEFDTKPNMPKHNRLALVVYSILHAMESWQEERRETDVGFSLN